MTPSQTVGPFYSFGLAWLAGEQLVDPAAPDAIRIAGCVYDGAGAPVPDAVVEIWQADARGSFAARPEWSGFGRSLVDATGQFRFATVKPGRVAGQAPHIAVSVFARGLLQRAVTRIYFPDEAAANAADPVLAAIADAELRATLVAVSDPSDARALRFDIHLQGPRETTFFLVG